MISTKVDITEAKMYSIIVGIDFLNKIKANIDIRKGLMTFEYNDQKGKVPIKFIHGDRGEPIFDETISEEDESEEDSESEFEKQYLEKKTFLMWQHDDWDTVTLRQQEFQDNDSVEIITKEAWIPIATPKR